jgi:hypothetical protein
MSKEKLILKEVVPFDELTEHLRRVVFRGIYTSTGEPLYPYQTARFTQARVVPGGAIGREPSVHREWGTPTPLFSAQPTIYENQSQIIRTVAHFLEENGLDLLSLPGAVHYTWEGRGDFHILPPIVEKHTYDLYKGFLDLNTLCERLREAHVRDARGTLHSLHERYLTLFYIDDARAEESFDLFHSHAPLINYGLSYSGAHDFSIVCDGMHRLDYALETKSSPMSVIFVEGESTSNPLYPYYAFPTPFYPTIRLTSKRSEALYPHIERDKIHLFNNFLRKVLHYKWETGGLSVSHLRSTTDIY